MPFLPLVQMDRRIGTVAEDSDGDYFDALMYCGEFVCKLVVAGLVAAIADDPDRYRYRQIHRLVRANGIGEWVHALDDVLSGPTSQFIIPEAHDDTRSLSQKVAEDAWQHRAVTLLHQCSSLFVDDIPQSSGGKQALRSWFSIFALLRNKTRGHGAPSVALFSKAVPLLRDSISEIRQNLPLFQRPWAHLHQNQSRKYKVSCLGDDAGVFDALRKQKSATWADGLYIDFGGKTCGVELIQTDTELTDIFCANGSFTGSRYELLSYATGRCLDAQASPYLAPATELPPSQTEGLGGLYKQGRCFGNLPPVPQGYIGRPKLQSMLQECLEDERHPIVTLHGPGGIGKTSLALSVLHNIATSNRFEVIVWFSARDIELLPDGPKPVRPHVLKEQDMAREYLRLMRPDEQPMKDSEATRYFSKELGNAEFGATLFVFDNFETMTAPDELYRWIDTYVRLPNKVLITSRFRAFNGDYQVEVGGMEEAESRALIDTTARVFGIYALLTEEYRAALYTESDGQPYVIKILLGEVAKEKRLVSIERIVADREQILTALFERSYTRLSAGARRVFLTLCKWRSLVPFMALKAVLLRPKNERLDVDEAIAELERCALVDIARSDFDEQTFLGVPLAASIFGRRKLIADVLRSAVEADVDLLQTFGAAQQADLRHGFEPRVKRMFSEVSARIAANPDALEEYKPVLEFVATGYPRAWRDLATLYEESGRADSLALAREAIQKYLENSTAESRADGWRRMADLARREGDYRAEIHAWSEFADAAKSDVEAVSEAANNINWLFSRNGMDLESEEKHVIVRRVTAAFRPHAKNASATNLSRLAWLHMHLQEEDKAREYARLGLERDAANDHVRNLARHFRMSTVPTA